MEGIGLIVLSVFMFPFYEVNCATTRSGKSNRCSSLDPHWNTTPGKCVNFLFCPRLLEYAKRPVKSEHDFRVLKKLTCGFRNDKPKICCPDEDIQVPPQPGENDYLNLPLLFPEELSSDSGPPSHLSPYAPVIEESQAFNEEERPSAPESSRYLNIKSKNIEQLIPEDCGEPWQDVLTSSRIIGGTKAEPGQYPYVVSLVRIDTVTDEEENYCGATIINAYYALTAGHCILTNENTNDVLAFLQVGITDLSQRCNYNEQKECHHDRRYEIEEAIVHPKYVYGSRDRSNDIALIRTKKPIDFDKKFIKPVCLPFGMSKLENELGVGIVAGWGRVSNDVPQSSTHLKSAVLPIIPRNECQRRYAGQVEISEKQLCAGRIGADTCIGDSGGPLLVPYESLKSGHGRFHGKMVQVGIVSFGPAFCAKYEKPSVYTNVVEYLDWIVSSMRL